MTSPADIFEEKVLRRCQKPGRYTGGELNSVRKDWDGAVARWGLLFPDLYEIGISNLGISILYGILNSQPGTLAERFYMPAPDAVKLLREEGIPPLSLENRMPASAFDIIGITLPYELTVSNVLGFLALSGIPLQAAERGFPVLIGGGALAFNPLPMCAYFDAFVVGDGEEPVRALNAAYLETGHDKSAFLDRISRIRGVYVPSLHDRNSSTIQRAVLSDLNESEVTPLVPLVESTFNRLSLEAARGCTRGCRFCFAGMVQRPYRERDVKNTCDFFSTWLTRTGFDEFSPSSLSISDHSRFSDLFRCLWELGSTRKASVSLPSLRVGSISPDLADKIRSFRKTGFTIAPETWPAMQAKLNKNVDFADMEQDIRNAFDHGWQNIKLYFMIGLPGEDASGLYEIRDFVKSVLRTLKTKRPNITISFSTFVPKPHTPLQWEAMDSLDTIIEKQKILKDLFFRERKIYLKLHDPGMSVLEGMIARGDERMSSVIGRASEYGALYDAWDEHFNYSLWERAITEETDHSPLTGQRGFDVTKPLPWNFIDAGLKTEFLLAEREKYYAGITTGDCRREACNECGACDFTEKQNRFSSTDTPLPVQEQNSEIPVFIAYLICYEKKGAMRYLSNLDILRLWHRLLRITGIRLKYSQGFNPQPAIDGGWAIPLGMESLCELLKFESAPLDCARLIDTLGSIAPEGLTIISINPCDARVAVDHLIQTAEFRCTAGPAHIDFDRTAEIMIKKGDTLKQLVAGDFVRDFSPGDSEFRFTIELRPGGLKPLDFAAFMAGKEVSAFDLIKTRVTVQGGATFGAGTGN